MKNVKEPRPEHISLLAKPKLIISETLQRHIDQLHIMSPGLEWSGELITTESGSIDHPSEWTITAEDIFLADIGTSGYTSYTAGEGAWMPDDVMEMYEKYPGLLDGSMKNQHIHTHHNMTSFFSGTDWEQMEDRSAASNYLLMLIVNKKGVYSAKVGFRAKRRDEGNILLSFVNNSDGFSDIRVRSKSDKDVLVTMDCEIEYSSVSVDTDFYNRWEAVDKANKPATVSHYKGAVQQRFEWDGYTNDNEDTFPVPARVNKSIGEMTDKEWNHSQASSELGGREVNIFINSILDGAIGKNSYYPIDRVVALDTNRKARIKFLERLEEESFEYWCDLFPAAHNFAYYPFLTAVKAFFAEKKSTSDTCKMAVEILEKEFEESVVV